MLAIFGVIILIIAANQRQPSLPHHQSLILDWLPLIDGAVWGQRFDELMQGLDSLTRLGDAARLIGYTISSFGFRLSPPIIGG